MLILAVNATTKGMLTAMFMVDIYSWYGPMVRQQNRLGHEPDEEHRCHRREDQAKRMFSFFFRRLRSGRCTLIQTW